MKGGSIPMQEFKVSLFSNTGTVLAEFTKEADDIDSLSSEIRSFIKQETIEIDSSKNHQIIRTFLKCDNIAGFKLSEVVRPRAIAKPF